MDADHHLSEPATSVEHELLALLNRQVRRVPIPVFLAAVLVAGLAYGRVPNWLIAVWLGLVVVVLIARRLVLGRVSAAGFLTIDQKLRLAVAMSATNGITHGLSLAFFPWLPDFHRVLLSMILIGLCAGSVATTAGHRGVFLGYTLPILLPLSALWVATPGTEAPEWVSRSTGVLILLLGVILVALAGDVFRLFKESFDIRLEQSALNRKLRAALEEAEAASRAKTRFLASASHDLRQPMQTLSVFAAALAMRPLDERSHEIAQYMNEALLDLTSELDALLDVSKLDAGVVRANVVAVPLGPVLQRMHQAFETAAREKGLDLRVDAPGELVVRADRQLLERVLRNLLENAVKYTRQGWIALDARVTGDTAVLRVRDTGPGIAPQEQDRVFEEFYQLDNPERDRKKGLGLGLAIVRRLVDLMDMGLELHSQLGQGSSFVLTMPLAQAGGVEQPAPAAPWPLGRLKVLVVDDELAVARAMQVLLEETGCDVAVAADTAEALQRARETRPHIVLADLRLRGEDSGLKTISALRQLYPGLPALIVSGDTAPERLQEVRGAGIELLHKPLRREAIFTGIARAMEESEHERQRAGPD